MLQTRFQSFHIQNRRKCRLDYSAHETGKNGSNENLKARRYELTNSDLTILKNDEKA